MRVTVPPLRSILPLAVLLGALALPACESGRTAELEIRLDSASAGGRATQEALERVLERRASAAGLTDFSLKWTGPATAVVRVSGARDLERTARWLSLRGTLEFRWTDSDRRFAAALPAMDSALAAAGVPSPERPAPSAPSAASTNPLGLEVAPPAEPTPTLPSPLGWRLFSFAGRPGEFLVADEEVPLVDSLIRLPAVEALMPPGIELVWGAEPIAQGARSFRPLYALERQPVITGAQLEEALATAVGSAHRGALMFTLTRAAGERFEEATGRHVGDFLAMVIDGEVFGQPPVIRDPVGRHGQIDLGDASLEQAQDLAVAIGGGALPVPVTVVKADFNVQ